MFQTWQYWPLALGVVHESVPVRSSSLSLGRVSHFSQYVPLALGSLQAKDLTSEFHLFSREQPLVMQGTRGQGYPQVDFKQVYDDCSSKEGQARIDVEDCATCGKKRGNLSLHILDGIHRESAIVPREVVAQVARAQCSLFVVTFCVVYANGLVPALEGTRYLIHAAEVAPIVADAIPGARFAAFGAATFRPSLQGCRCHQDQRSSAGQPH